MNLGSSAKPGAGHVTPRPAATVVVATRSPSGLEILLLRRPNDARFGAGVWAFPGGAVDEDDTDAMWANRRPVAGEAASCVAALRELFEETGILPAAPSGFDPEVVAGARRRLLAGQTRFSRLAERLGLDFSSTRVVYFARWITPRGTPLRFDTRFFLLALEQQSSDVSLTPEHEASLWTTPAAALRRFSDGELPMMFPTVRTIERLAGFPSLDAAVEALRDVQVEPALVRLRIDEKGVQPVAPGDPGYDELT